MIRRPLKRGSSASFLCIGAGILEDLSGTDELRPRATYSLSAYLPVAGVSLKGWCHTGCRHWRGNQPERLHPIPTNSIRTVDSDADHFDAANIRSQRIT